MNLTDKSGKRTLPIWGWVGFALILIFWPINWFFPGSRSIWAFFPLWAGYSLALDGIVYYRTNTSQIGRSKKGFASLFIISAPSWWLFEFINRRVQNWHYIGIDGFTEYEFFFLSTLNFSTVVPAIFEAAELLVSFGLFFKTRFTLFIPKTKRVTISFFASGLFMLILLLLWPVYFFPFMWMSVYFILEPVNIWLGNESLADFTEKGDWRPVFYLFSGALMTGFFWEFWNYFSYPKWEYTIPFVGFAKIFEMPILGYLGYLPFALEIFVIFQISNSLIKVQNSGLFQIFKQTCKSL
jgi:hypothetical protein